MEGEIKNTKCKNVISIKTEHIIILIHNMKMYALLPLLFLLWSHKSSLVYGTMIPHERIYKVCACRGEKKNAFAASYSYFYKIQTSSSFRWTIFIDHRQNTSSNHKDKVVLKSTYHHGLLWYLLRHNLADKRPSWNPIRDLLRLRGFCLVCLTACSSRPWGSH